MNRRKSFDSSSSSDSSSSNGSSSSSGKHKKINKVKKDKKDKHKKDKSDKQHKLKSNSQSVPPPAFPQSPSNHYQPSFPPVPPPAAIPAAMSYGFDDPNAHFRAQEHFGGSPPAPPSYNQPQPPPSGYRIPLSTDAPIPAQAQTGWPPLYDADGVSPIFIGSALFENSVHPCKIGPHLQPTVCSVAYAGKEYAHHGRYDLMPFVAEQMEWVATSHGRIPHGRRPIEGGYEDNGNKLYHGLANLHGVRVPGKTGEHLAGCNVPFGGKEVEVRDNYEILCWKF